MLSLNILGDSLIHWKLSDQRSSRMVVINQQQISANGKPGMIFYDGDIEIDIDWSSTYDGMMLMISWDDIARDLSDLQKQEIMGIMGW